jgi:hypothetical protein
MLKLKCKLKLIQKSRPKKKVTLKSIVRIIKSQAKFKIKLKIPYFT